MVERFFAATAVHRGGADGLGGDNSKAGANRESSCHAALNCGFVRLGRVRSAASGNPVPVQAPDLTVSHRSYRPVSCFWACLPHRVGRPHRRPSPQNPGRCPRTKFLCSVRSIFGLPSHRPGDGIFTSSAERLRHPWPVRGAEPLGGGWSRTLRMRWSVDSLGTPRVSALKLTSSQSMSSREKRRHQAGGRSLASSPTRGRSPCVARPSAAPTRSVTETGAAVRCPRCASAPQTFYTISRPQPDFHGISNHAILNHARQRRTIVQILLGHFG